MSSCHFWPRIRNALSLLLQNMRDFLAVTTHYGAGKGAHRQGNGLWRILGDSLDISETELVSIDFSEFWYFSDADQGTIDEIRNSRGSLIPKLEICS